MSFSKLSLLNLGCTKISPISMKTEEEDEGDPFSSPSKSFRCDPPRRKYMYWVLATQCAAVSACWDEMRLAPHNGIVRSERLCKNSANFYQYLFSRGMISLTRQKIMPTPDLFYAVVKGSSVAQNFRKFKARSTSFNHTK